jgi:cytochrome c
MKLVTLVKVAVAAGALTAGGAQAADIAKVKDILTANACMACHTIEKKVVGPSYTEVGAKYKGKEAEAATLTKHVREGSSGVWGPIPMPPNKNISDADLKIVVDWLIAGAPQ